MLILIPGITGNLGHTLAREALERHHEVRGLGRSPSKLDGEIQKLLESFVKTKSYDDVKVIEKACQGVDAVVVAYSGKPELQLDGQLILLRAAERAGIKRFHAASWNAYWPNLRLGDHEMMDPYLCFARQAEVSSSIKPIYLFTGVLTEVFFSVPGHGDFTPAHNGIWDPENKSITYWGTGDEKWNCTAEQDAAAYSIELLTREGAEKGGKFKVHGGMYSPKDVQEIYERIKGRQVVATRLGGLEDLNKKAFRARREGDVRECWKYIGLCYQLLTLEGRWTWEEDETVGRHFPHIRPASLEEWLRDHVEV